MTSKLTAGRTVFILMRGSHCPWIDNCVGANNLRHFVLYIICLEIGIIIFVQLTVACECLSRTREDQLTSRRHQRSAGASGTDM
jgi:hypothetical protein